jgi:hypothetical protein
MVDTSRYLDLSGVPSGFHEPILGTAFLKE